MNATLFLNLAVIPHFYIFRSHSSIIRELSSKEVKLNFIIGISKEIFQEAPTFFFLINVSVVYSKSYLILDNSWHSCHFL